MMDKLPTELFDFVYNYLDPFSQFQLRSTCTAYFRGKAVDEPPNHKRFICKDKAITFSHDVLAFWLLFVNKGFMPGYARIQTIQIEFDYMDIAQSEWDIICLAISKVQPTSINATKFQFVTSGSFLRIAQLVTQTSSCTVFRLKEGVSVVII